MTLSLERNLLTDDWTEQVDDLEEALQAAPLQWSKGRRIEDSEHPHDALLYVTIVRPHAIIAVSGWQTLGPPDGDEVHHTHKFGLHTTEEMVRHIRVMWDAPIRVTPGFHKA